MMLQQYLSELRAQIALLRDLLSQPAIPEAQAQAITTKLDQMLDIIAEYEKGTPR